MLVLNALQAILEGLNLKIFRGSIPRTHAHSRHMLTRSKWASPIANLLRNSVSAHI